MTAVEPTTRHPAAPTGAPTGAVAERASWDTDTAPVPRVTIGGPLSAKRFGLGLGAIVLAGLAGRVGYVLIVTRHENAKIYDAFWYGFTADGLSLHEFFRTPFALTPTAAHPPLTSLLLSPSFFLFGFHAGFTAPRLTMAVLGAGVVLCVGLLGRSLAGPWVGLTAAMLAAGAPNFWIPNGILMSETPAMLGMALILLAVLRLRRRPTAVSALLLGVACGAEALVRAELILFVPFLLVPAALVARPASLSRKLGLLGLGLAAVVLVLAPWVGRNLATFTDATFISTGDGLALLGANCPQTYYGPYLGAWSFSCAVSVTAKGDESVQAAAEQHAAVQYAEHNRGRLLVVAAARVGRLWDVYQPVQMADFDVNEGRPRDASLAGLVVYYALVPLALAGTVMLRRRRLGVWMLLMPAVVVTVVSILFYGLVRFRAPFEVCLVVLAAPPVVTMVQAVGRRLGSAAPRGQHARRRPALE